MCCASRRRLLLQLGCSLAARQLKSAAFEFCCACKHRYVTDATTHKCRLRNRALIAVYRRLLLHAWHALRRQASLRVRRMDSRRAAEGCVDADSIRAWSAASARKTLGKQASRGASLFLAAPVQLSVAEESHYLLSLIRSAVKSNRNRCALHARSQGPTRSSPGHL